jgi:hypothetical protein
MLDCFASLAMTAPFRSYVAAAVLALSPLAVPSPAGAARIKHPVAIFAGLDKITGRTIAFEAAAGETVQFGTLQITERACFTHPATEAPQTATFVEVDEVSAGNQFKRIFSGWMFAASPGLHGIEHPIYDIWLTNCGGEGVAEGGPGAPEEAAPAKAVSPLPENAPAAAEEKHSREPRRGKPRATPAPASESDVPEPERGGAGTQAPELGQPIEVGPPPGLIPAPQEGRRPPVQRYYPAGPSVVPDPSGGY